MRTIGIYGAAKSGKTRFMHEMIEKEEGMKLYIFDTNERINEDITKLARKVTDNLIISNGLLFENVRDNIIKFEPDFIFIDNNKMSIHDFSWIPKVNTTLVFTRDTHKGSYGKQEIWEEVIVFNLIYLV